MNSDDRRRTKSEAPQSPPQAPASPRPSAPAIPNPLNQTMLIPPGLDYGSSVPFTPTKSKSTPPRSSSPPPAPPQALAPLAKPNPFETPDDTWRRNYPSQSPPRSPEIPTRVSESSALQTALGAREASDIAATRDRDWARETYERSPMPPQVAVREAPSSSTHERPQLELLYHDAGFLSQVRSHFIELIDDMEPPSRRSVVPGDLAELLHVLHTAERPTDAAQVPEKSERRVGSGSLPPLQVWDGTFEFEYSPQERLRVAHGEATRIKAPTPEVSRLIALIRSELEASAPMSPRVAGRLEQELAGAARWTERQRDELTLTLCEARAYRQVDVFGAKHVRGLFRSLGTSIVAYLPVDAAMLAPLFHSFSVTLLAERRAKQEQDTDSPFALRIRAIARHLDPSSASH